MHLPMGSYESTQGARNAWGAAESNSYVWTLNFARL